jgi:hypothetical protein
MKRKLYYVIELEHDDIGGILECNGSKYIRCYVVKEESLSLLIDFYLDVSDNTIKGIEEELESEGFEPSEFELVQL